MEVYIGTYNTSSDIHEGGQAISNMLCATTGHLDLETWNTIHCDQRIYGNKIIITANVPEMTTFSFCEISVGGSTGNYLSSKYCSLVGRLRESLPIFNIFYTFMDLL